MENEVTPKTPETAHMGIVCPKCKHNTDQGAKACPACQTIFLDDTESVAERLARIRNYRVGKMLLKEREYLFEAIYRGERLTSKVVYCCCYSLLLAALYGAVLGAYGGWQSSLIMAVKVPLSFLATLFVAVPLLFIFTISLGARLSLWQVFAMKLVATYLVCLALLSFAPILGLFILFSDNMPFLHLINLIFFAIAGTVGIGFLWEGIGYCVTKNHRELKAIVVYAWSTVYVFVFLQCAWTLKIFGDLTQLPIFKQLKIEGDFYTVLFELAKKLMGGGGGD